ncbi:MAG: murein biosynthesis integral membrane protein MurJ [Bryobacteraceae bacterium]
MVSAAVLLSRVSGLIREVLMARLFGAGAAYDAFLLGFRIPNLTRDLFAEGALSAAFVPTFSEYLSQKGRNEAASLANLVATAVVLFVGALCVLGMVFSPQLVGLLAPGFAAVPGKTELTIHMTRIMFPFLLLVALAAQAMGVLNACNQFGVPALASSMFNIGSLVFGLTLGFLAGPRMGLEPIEGMAWGVVAGGALQMLWQFPSLRRQGFTLRPAIDWRHPGLIRIIRLMGPAIIGNAAVQINVMVNTNFASRIEDVIRGPDGPVSWLSFAFRFFQLPLGLFGVAIASATLPSISRSLAGGDMIEFRRTLSRSLGVVFLLTVPSSIGLVVLGPAMIAAVFEGGKFGVYDTRQTAVALSCYAVGLAGYSAVKVLNPAFYALNDARTPMLISLASIVINYAAASILVTHTSLGHAGLALSTSAVALFSFLCLFLILRHRAGGVYGRDLASSGVKVAMAALLMGALVSVSSDAISGWLGESRLRHITNLAISIPAGLLVFWGACRALRVPELELAWNAIGEPLRRLVIRLR